MKQIDEWTIEEDDGSEWEIKDKGNKVWWLVNEDDGAMVFSFDRKKAFNLWQDYPGSLTADQKEIFDNEDPFWRDYFSGRYGHG